MNTLSSLLEWIGNTIGANPSTLSTTSKTLVGAINEVASNPYPVGSYYWTSDESFNPASIWSGSWEKMDAGMVLVSAGTNYPVSAGVHKDGGSKDAIVPSHNHSVGALSVPIKQEVNCSGTGGKNLYYVNGSEQRYLTVPAHNTNYTGVSATNANMPPYKNAYCWHRYA